MQEHRQWTSIKHLRCLIYPDTLFCTQHTVLGRQYPWIAKVNLRMCAALLWCKTWVGSAVLCVLRGRDEWHLQEESFLPCQLLFLCKTKEKRSRTTDRNIESGLNSQITFSECDMSCMPHAPGCWLQSKPPGLCSHREGQLSTFLAPETKKQGFSVLATKDRMLFKLLWPER